MKWTLGVACRATGEALPLQWPPGHRGLEDALGDSSRKQREGEDGDDDRHLCRSRSRRNHTTAPYLARQMSMDFVSQEQGVPHDGPKDSNAGG
jgi:hypothetical protein